MTDLGAAQSGTGNAATCVRFTPEEYTQIQADQRTTGQSIPTLLKFAYFKNGPVVPLMSKEDQKALMGALGRIGNNINQIARQLNGGFREGFNDAILDVRAQFSMLLTFLTSSYGDLRKKPGRPR